jgi:DNA-binding transcriptional ArsR family regulator
LTLGRLIVGSVALGIFAFARHEPFPTRRDLPLIAFSGITWFSIYNVALNAAEQRVDAGTAAMLVNVGPLMIIVFAGLFLTEGFPRTLIVGGAVSFLGVVLTKLTDAGLVSSTRQGRHTYYQIASEEVAAAIEALSLVSSELPISSWKESRTRSRLYFARTCYDHLAGRLGVSVTEALLSTKVLKRVAGDFLLTPDGREWSRGFGFDLQQRSRRPLVKACLDSTHRRFHVAGQLGREITNTFLANKWIVRAPSSRMISLTPKGEEGLRTEFGINWTKA